MSAAESLHGPASERPRSYRSVIAHLRIVRALDGLQVPKWVIFTMVERFKRAQKAPEYIRSYKIAAITPDDEELAERIVDAALDDFSRGRLERVSERL